MAGKSRNLLANDENLNSDTELAAIFVAVLSSHALYLLRYILFQRFEKQGVSGDAAFRAKKK